MSNKHWVAVAACGLLVSWLLMPGEPEPPPRGPVSVLGPAPALHQWPSEPTARPVPQAGAVIVDVASAAAVTAMNNGPFAPRPRPPAVVSFGAAAPLAAGQDASAYFWGGEKPDLSD
jgi:hypothetical protein